MDFKINHEFAKNYISYRRKEEIQKLKERHGDVKLNGKRKKKISTASPEDEDNPNDVVTSSSDGDSEQTDSSSSSEEEEESSSDEQDHNDFLVLYEALCKNDPSLKDTSKQWFSDSRSDRLSGAAVGNGDSSSAEKQPSRESVRHRSVTLRDQERDFLLTQNGVEDDQALAEAERIQQLESDHILQQMNETTDQQASKDDFLRFVIAFDAAVTTLLFIIHPLFDETVVLKRLVCQRT